MKLLGGSNNEGVQSSMTEEHIHPAIVVGGVYAIREGLIRWGVVKVLKHEDGVVHLRYYRNKFWRRPGTVVIDQLSLGNLHDERGFGIGHMPFSEEQFRRWPTALLVAQDVSEDELEGFRNWGRSMVVSGAGFRA